MYKVLKFHNALSTFGHLIVIIKKVNIISVIEKKFISFNLAICEHYNFDLNICMLYTSDIICNCKRNA